MDREFLSSFAMLVTGNIDTIDAFGSMTHTLAHKTVVEPFAHTQMGLTVILAESLACFPSSSGDLVVRDITLPEEYVRAGLNIPSAETAST